VLASARAAPLVLLHKNICPTPKVERFGGTVKHGNPVQVGISGVRAAARL